MGKNCKHIVISFFLIFLFSGLSYAESLYVTDITQITMRTAPGNEHRIVTMIESGSLVNVLEQSGTWSKVKTKDGKEGWALTRFLSDKKPAVILLSELKKESKQFLILKKQYQEILKKFEDQQEEITNLEDNHKDRMLMWFLIGAGVFVFGVLLGMGTKKRRRSYLK